MKQKTLAIILGVEAVLLSALVILTNYYPDLFSSLFAFPFLLHSSCSFPEPQNRSDIQGRAFIQSKQNRSPAKPVTDHTHNCYMHVCHFCFARLLMILCGAAAPRLPTPVPYSKLSDHGSALWWSPPEDRNFAKYGRPTVSSAVFCFYWMFSNCWHPLRSFRQRQALALSCISWSSVSGIPHFSSLYLLCP